jgi:hypothetical protein
MRYFGRSRYREEAPNMPRTVPEPTDEDEALRAVERATARLEESHQRWLAVRRVVRGLDDAKTANHFAEKIAEAYRSRD